MQHHTETFFRTEMKQKARSEASRRNNFFLVLRREASFRALSLFFDSPRFASARYFRTVVKLKARSEASRQRKTFPIFKMKSLPKINPPL